MEEFVSKYIFPVLVALTIMVVSGIIAIFKMFHKTTFSDKMQEFKKSLELFKKNIDDLKGITDSTVTNIERIIGKVEELMLKLDDVEERIEKKIDAIDKKYSYEVEKLSNNIIKHGEALHELQGEHNAMHNNYVNRKK